MKTCLAANAGLYVGLPGIDGVDGARRILANEGRYRATVQVALTGWGQEDDKQRACQTGFDRRRVKSGRRCQ
jgi:CheY-like chemotaxis protein